MTRGPSTFASLPVGTADLSEAVDTMVALHPDQPALECKAGSLSYRQMGEAVAALAAELEREVIPDGFVAIEAQRSPVAVIGMLAALRTRRPFVVIDPRDGDEANRRKVALMSLTRIVREKTTLRPRLTELPASWGRVEDATPRADLGRWAGNVAYAIHTSGSTGEPKCVLVGRGGLGAVIEDHVRKLDVGPQSRTLQFARLTFDGCLTEIFWTICGGGTLVMVDETALAPGAVLQETLERLSITHLKTTPFALTSTAPTDQMRLRHVINGGGACRRGNVERWSRYAVFHNAYGCTETTICNLLSGELSAASCVDGIPLGQPVGLTQVDIVPDRSVPDDTRGELVITGPAVGIGYLQDDGVDVFLGPMGEALYRTGDLVERRGNALYYVERIDRQMKVRGYRIDPGEVEDVVCRFDGVEEAVVLAESHTDPADTDGADALVCYVQGTVDTRDLRAHLEARLAPYKVPSIFKHVDAMPYTANGKVDRAALYALRMASGPTITTTPHDAILALVAQLTGTEDVTRGDNFFDVGGDSASSLVLLQKLKELGWVTAGVRDVIRAPDLGALIDSVERQAEAAECVV